MNTVAVRCLRTLVVGVNVVVVSGGFFELLFLHGGIIV